ncbi:MAG: GNAT family N-acetyltransferase [Gammaproteobacteria bacterium]|nr:MAG: GNAT family N-acetyltransferase [Gammaproteobacteria bacterium]
MPLSLANAASAEDSIEIRSLLESSGLPTSDLASARPEFVVVREQGRVVAAGALERFGACALLRSVVVTPDRRGSGLGHAIVLELERLAREAKIERLFLLTETAAGFFARHGYQLMERSAAPPDVQRSEEFRSLCPASATCMAKAFTESVQETSVSGRLYNVLFLCTGNSARSIIAEALINHWGRGKFRGFSAGSHPRGAVHPIALELLRRMKIPTDGLRSKSWDEFAAPGAPLLDFVFTVCDNAAGEVCPCWPGQPMTAHWGLPDPAAVEGTETDKWLAFRSAFQALDNRIKIFTSLPLTSLDRIKLQERLDAIGKTAPPEAR